MEHITKLLNVLVILEKVDENMNIINKISNK